MKIRAGFVSNSSSSSFIVNMKHLTPAKLEALRDFLGREDYWHVDQKTVRGEDHILCETSMENASYDERMDFLTELLGPGNYEEQ